MIQWTGKRWIISLSKNNEAKSIHEKIIASKNKQIEDFKKSKIAQDIKTYFPDAELIDLNEEE